MSATSIGAVIFKTRRQPLYLLLHYAAGHWGFVKGNVEQGESEHATVQRETSEETGITDLTFLREFREVIHYAYRAAGTLISKEVILYIAETQCSDVTL